MRWLHYQGTKKGYVPYKLDIENAFRLLPNHPLWSLYDAIRIDREGKTEWYYDLRLNFGGAGNPRLFCLFGDMLVWIAKFHYGIDLIFHYVDDYFGISHAVGDNEPGSMAKFRQLCKDLNITLNQKSDFGDGIIIIGLKISVSNGTIKLPTYKLVDYLSTIKWWAHSTQKDMTVNNLEHLIGILNWSLNLIPCGRLYVAAFWEAKGQADRQKKASFARININPEMNDSLRWWNGALSQQPTRYVLKELHWPLSTADELVFVDASGKIGLGIYLPWRKTALWHDFSPKSSLLDTTVVDINNLELLAIWSAKLWLQSRRSQAAKLKVVIMSDSKVCCDVLSGGTSRQYLLREMMKKALFSAVDAIDIRVCHTSGVINPADALSRGPAKRSEFLQLYQPLEIIQFNPPEISSLVERARSKNTTECE